MARRQYPKGEELAKSFLNKLKNYPNFEIIWLRCGSPWIAHQAC